MFVYFHIFFLKLTSFSSWFDSGYTVNLLPRFIRILKINSLFVYCPIYRKDLSFWGFSISILHICFRRFIWSSVNKWRILMLFLFTFQIVSRCLVIVDWEHLRLYHNSRVDLFGSHSSTFSSWLLWITLGRYELFCFRNFLQFFKITTTCSFVKRIKNFNLKNLSTLFSIWFFRLSIM